MQTRPTTNSLKGGNSSKSLPWPRKIREGKGGHHVHKQTENSGVVDAGSFQSPTRSGERAFTKAALRHGQRIAQRVPASLPCRMEGGKESPRCRRSGARGRERPVSGSASFAPWAYGRVALHLLPGRGAHHGLGPGRHAGHGCARTVLRRCPPVQLRRLCHAGAA